VWRGVPAGVEVGGVVQRKQRRQRRRDVEERGFPAFLVSTGGLWLQRGADVASSIDSSFSYSLFSSSSSGARRCGQGMESPEAGRVGSAGGALLTAAGGGGCVDGADVRTGARPRRDGAPSPARRCSAHRRH
jgi:hypothetical protein